MSIHKVFKSKMPNGGRRLGGGTIDDIISYPSDKDARNAIDDLVGWAVSKGGLQDEYDSTQDLFMDLAKIVESSNLRDIF